jgi:hypothetical protein
MGELYIVGGAKEPNPYANAFEDSTFMNHKRHADNLRLSHYSNEYIKGLTGVDFDVLTPKKIKRPLFDLPRDECGIQTRHEREMQADQQEMREAREYETGRIF